MAEYVTLKKNDGTIIYPQIGNGTVTDSKIDFSSFSGSGYIQLGSILIQWGQSQLSSSNYSANFTVNLSKTYGNTNYNAMVSPVFNESGGSFWWTFVCTKSNQSFTCRAGYKAVNSSGGNGGNVIVNWVTIGVTS